MYTRKRKASGSYGGRGYLKRARIITGPRPQNVIIRAFRRQRRRNFALRRQNLATLGFLGIERKFYDTTLAATAITSSAVLAGGMLDPSATSMITTPSQGDGEQMRDGKQISCLYIEICGNVRSVGIEGTGAPPLPCSVYIACVLDTQSNATQCLSSDIFKSQGASVLLATSPMRNLVWGKRFRILKQAKFMFNPEMSVIAADQNSAGAQQRDFKWFIPMKGLRINFNTTTTPTIAAVSDNSVHMVGFVNSAEQVYNISYNARLRFVG